ncbi:TetR family transcriptional regulator [Actinoplanes sp. NBRC 14428]|uniref:TetR family transcriptional regulator n=1 Tax=Pseudosporangium ferrugineum TaxID=439699 RepID=A0A2T0SFF0_9ACTN|nr:TetR family transcriptional regulator [Pseudosporangium ferrugineum]PRY32134.1 TetR family transcriptional regulator [Pseudosporangium ferrugineum]BCJ49623.1 TetR family transcriptional regulator [Actinoplanes sp. NBRC 14428]
MTVEHDVPPRRSDRTRAAILAAARERFAADGYAKATIRAIAAQAGIDPSMVMRYYGSKEKLLAAAAEFGLEMPDVSQLSTSARSAALVQHLIDLCERDDTMIALLRLAATQQAAAERARTIVAQQIEPVVATIEPDPELATRRTGLLATQMMGLALTRYVLQLPAVVAMTAEELVAWISPVVEHYLTGRPE